MKIKALFSSKGRDRFHQALKTKASLSLGTSGTLNYIMKYQKARVFNMNAVETSNLAFIGVSPEYPD